MNRPEPPAGVGKFGAPTSRRNPSVRAVRPTHRAAQQLLGPNERSVNVLDDLTWHREDGSRIDPPKPAKSAAEIRAASQAFVASDPGMQAFLARQASDKARPLFADLTMLAARYQSGEMDDEEFARAQRTIAQEIKATAPRDYAAFIDRANTLHLEDIERWRQTRVEDLIDDGYEPWQAQEIADEELEDVFNADLPGTALSREVEAVEQIERSSKIIETLTARQQKSDDAFMSVAKELVNAGDRESEARFLHTKEWIAEAGFDLEKLVAEGDGEKAGAYLRSAYAQQDARERAEAVAEMKKSIMDAPSTNIADGLTTGADAQAAKQDALLDAIEQSNTLKLIEMGVSLPTARGMQFDPEWQPEPTATQTADPSLNLRLKRDESGEPVRNPETGAVVAALGAVDEAADADSRLTKYGYSDSSGRPISEEDASELAKGSLDSGLHGLAAR